MVGTPGSNCLYFINNLGPVRWSRLSKNMRIYGVEGRGERMFSNGILLVALGMILTVVISIPILYIYGCYLKKCRS